MLALLHTARAHVETFGQLAREIDDSIPIRHEVREGLLADALAAGASASQVQLAVASAVRALADDGAQVIVCTCSTIAGIAESVPVSDRVAVMRIDRAMAERAVESGRRIVVLAALRSTFEPTSALLAQVASDLRRSIQVVEVLCPTAWRLFEIGDQLGYHAEVAKTIERVACAGDTVLLAQASMAPAAELVGHLGIPVLSSPRLGLEAAMSMYRTRCRPVRASLPCPLP